MWMFRCYPDTLNKLIANITFFLQIDLKSKMYNTDTFHPYEDHVIIGCEIFALLGSTVIVALTWKHYHIHPNRFNLAFLLSMNLYLITGVLRMFYFGFPDTIPWMFVASEWLVLMGNFMIFALSLYRFKVLSYFLDIPNRLYAITYLMLVVSGIVYGVLFTLYYPEPDEPQYGKVFIAHFAHCVLGAGTSLVISITSLRVARDIKTSLSQAMGSQANMEAVHIVHMVVMAIAGQALCSTVAVILAFTCVPNDTYSTRFACGAGLGFFSHVYFQYILKMVHLRPTAKTVMEPYRNNRKKQLPKDIYTADTTTTTTTAEPSQRGIMNSVVTSIQMSDIQSSVSQ